MVYKKSASVKTQFTLEWLLNQLLIGSKTHSNVRDTHEPIRIFLSKTRKNKKSNAFVRRLTLFFMELET